MQYWLRGMDAPAFQAWFHVGEFAWTAFVEN